MVNCRLKTLAAVLALGFGAAWLAQAADLQLTGRVTDENGAPVAGARVAVSPSQPPAAGPYATKTGPSGEFSVALPAAGDYRIGVQREGYYELKERLLHIETPQDVTLVVNHVREVFQSVNVNEQPSPVDISQTRNQEQLTGTEVNDIPFANSHSLRNAMQLLPGAVEDSGGGMHLNGSSENQVQYVLNGFDVTDPITGQFNSTLAVEGIRSVDYSSARYSPEFGKGTAGVLAISTENGTDAVHYTATDFIPGLHIQQGVHLGNWYPRLGISGPIVRGRAWYSDTFDFEYTNTLITGLPSGQNTRGGWTASNLLHTQINLAPRNILFADFLVNISDQGRVGLGPLDPVSTTLAVHEREYFGSVKDQIYVGKAVLELGYAHNDFSTTQTPQGSNPYLFSPQGRMGNYFVTSDQTSSRDQGQVHVYAPPFSFLGSHLIEAGAGGDLLHYGADIHRTSYELLGLNGQPLSQTAFFGPGVFGVSDTTESAWVLDTWRIARSLQVHAGLRQDWDSLVGAAGWSPRIAFSWAPFADGRTRVAGGYSVTHDAVPLAPFGQPLDQSAATTEFNANGTPAGPAALTTFALGERLKLPRAGNWSVNVDHQVKTHVTISFGYLRRRGTDGFDFVNTLAPGAPPSLLPLPNGTAAGEFVLSNLRRDDFDSGSITVRQTLAGQHEWMASYTRSRAESNALLDFNTLVPLAVLPGVAPAPWDAPNRILGWGYLPLPWKNWSIAVLADLRTGFPFSVQQQTGIIQGQVDSVRYPMNFDLNIALERIVTFRGYRFGLWGGVDNATAHRNPTAVMNVIGSPQYLQFFGDEGRHFVAKIRFFGRAKTTK